MFALAFMRPVPHRRSSFWHFDAIIPRYFWTSLIRFTVNIGLDVNVIGFKIKWNIMLSDSYKLAIALKNDLLSPHKSLFHSHTIFEQYDFLWSLDIIIELLHINFTLSFVFFVISLFAKIFNSFKYLIFFFFGGGEGGGTQNSPSKMFGSILNTPMLMIKSLARRFMICVVYV